MSLVDRSVSPGPTLPHGHPFTNVQSSFYWSASTSANNTSNAWAVNFFDGGVFSGDKSLSGFVWCVRGADRGWTLSDLSLDTALRAYSG